MRDVKPEWIKALRALTGQEGDTIRWNTELGRYEFVMAGADGVPRSQFWGQYVNPLTGERLAPDPVTGLYPYRELTDAGMVEALQNLEMTFVGNPADGAGTLRKQSLRRMRANRARRQQRFKEAAEAFAEMVVERGRRMRGAVQLTVPESPTRQP